MKHIMSIILGALLAATAFAQTTAPTPFIKGEIVIRYDTRTQLDGDKPKEGVTDKYKLRVNMSDSVIFDGSIDYLPFIKNKITSNQQGTLTHAIECFVVNPRNTSQTKNIGRLYGAVPIDENNVYRFEEGSLKIGIFGTGNSQGLESKVKGLMMGKPPVQSGIFSRVAKEAMKITSQINGKTVAIKVTNYDQATFQGHVLSAGPVMIYPETTINGPMLYDYDRSAWLLNGVVATYVEGNQIKTDRLSGNIRWVEATNRKTSGEGEYQFDIRVNEPVATEAAAFAASTSEEDFFSSDAQTTALTGTLKYKDTIVNGVVTQSLVAIDLKGNGLSKIQVMYLCKMLFVSCIVPLNAE